MTPHKTIQRITKRAENRIQKLTNKRASVIVLYPRRFKISFDQIKQLVCQVTDIPVEQVGKRCRAREYVLTRQIIALLTRSNCHTSLLSIANKLGLKDHATVISGIERVKQLLSANDEMAVDFFERSIKQLEQYKQTQPHAAKVN